MGKYNFNFFQIPQVGVNATGTGISSTMSRACNDRMSNFGSLVFGVRNAGDYTKVAFGFKDAKGNPNVPYFLPTGNYGNWGNAVNNPYVVGSTTKKVRNDEFKVMTLGSRSAISAKLPGFDTMDTRLVWNTTTSGFVANDMVLNFPTEGWTTFGHRSGGPFNYTVA